MKKLSVLSILVATLLLWGCSSSTDTALPLPAPTATIQGNVAGATEGISSQQTADVTVSVQGTNLATQADANGNFTLTGVPLGNVVLLFTSTEGTVPVVVENVKARQVVNVGVRLTPTAAVVTDIERNTEAYTFTLGNRRFVLNGASNGNARVIARLSASNAALADIDSSTFELSSRDGSIAPIQVSSGNLQLVIAFELSALLDILGDVAGTYEVSLSFVANGEAVTVGASVNVLVPEDDDGNTDGSDNAGNGSGNAGNDNAGNDNGNAGNDNAGNGNGNPGNDNAGNDNAGNGSGNAGNDNAGNDGSGNPGNDNAGNDNGNAGNDNAGNGNGNPGNDNAGNDNAGNGSGNAGNGSGNAGNDNAGNGSGNAGNDNAGNGSGNPGNSNGNPGNSNPGSNPNESPDDKTVGNDEVVALEDGYAISLVSVSGTRWTYRVEELEGVQDLSHWVLELPQCVAVVSASPEAFEVVDPDPTTRLSGIKWETTDDFTAGEFTVELDAAYTTGTVQVAAKGGRRVFFGNVAGPLCVISDDVDDSTNEGAENEGAENEVDDDSSNDGVSDDVNEDAENEVDDDSSNDDVSDDTTDNTNDLADNDDAEEPVAGDPADDDNETEEPVDGDEAAHDDATSDEPDDNQDVIEDGDESVEENEVITSVNLENGYVISLVSVSGTRWTYRVEELEGAQDLSHWVLELPECVSVVATSPEVDEFVDPDPTTNLSGAKWETASAFTTGEFTVELDGEYPTGIVRVATKSADVAVAELAGPACNSTATP